MVTEYDHNILKGAIFKILVTTSWINKQYFIIFTLSGSKFEFHSIKKRKIRQYWLANLKKVSENLSEHPHNCNDVL